MMKTVGVGNYAALALLSKKIDVNSRLRKYEKGLRAVYIRLLERYSSHSMLRCLGNGTVGIESLHP